MSIGLITITHNHIGAEILDTACQIFGEAPLPTRHCPVAADVDPAELRAGLVALVAELDHGDGVLLVTDLYGSTPCNIAHNHGTTHCIRVIAGLNLPMVLRIFNYAHLDLTLIAEKAATGGQRGIIADPAGTERA